MMLSSLTLVYSSTLAQEYRDFLQSFETACLKRSCFLGTLVWVETAAQHFPGPDRSGGLFGSFRGKCGRRGCAQHSYASKRTADFRNRMANHLMKRYSIPILKIWDVTATAFNKHAQNRAGTNCDCTQYCNSPWGVFRVYNRALQAYLEAFGPKPNL